MIEAIHIRSEGAMAPFEKQCSLILTGLDNMVLIEWKTDDKQQQLLDILLKEGLGIPNNLVMEASVQFSIEKRNPVACMRFFSTSFDEDSTPTYVFVVEENDNINGVTSIYARPPTCNHDRALLETALSELIEKFGNNGEIRLRSDTFTREVMCDLGDFDISYRPTIAVFYLTEEQREFGRKIELDASIPGFEVGTVDIEKDAPRIHENWNQSDSLETTKDYLRYLPSTIIRDSSTGEAVSWNMTSPFGQAINQFTLPEYRGRHLSDVAQYHYGKQMFSLGLSPFKYVQIQNTKVLEAAKRYRFSSMWEEQIENNNEIDKENATGKGQKTYFPLQHTVIKRKN